MEGEHLDELFLKFAEAGDQWNIESVEEMMKHNKCTGLISFFFFLDFL